MLELECRNKENNTLNIIYVLIKQKMRLPIQEKRKSLNSVNVINKKNHELMEAFENSLKKNIEFIKIKVMLGDFSVIEITTFDPNKIIQYFFLKEKEIKNDINWQVVSVQSSKSDDLHRIFFQISIEIERFYFYVYMGIQFHSLLYYKVDKDVLKISKKIRELEEKIYNMKDEITIKGDQIIKQELEGLGYKEVDNTQLFEELFTKKDMTEKLIQKASSVEETFPELEKNKLALKKMKKQLEDLIIEVYQINIASLDYNKMMQGEEGIVFYIDLEMIKNKKTREKTSIINFEKITSDNLLSIEKEFNFIINIFKNNSPDNVKAL